MDKKALDRLRTLAGTNKPVENPTDESRRNMYQIRDPVESAEDRARYDAANSGDKKKVTLKKAPWEKDKVKEAEKPDFADLDKDGDKKEPMAKAAKEKDLDESETKKRQSSNPANYSDDDDDDDEEEYQRGVNKARRRNPDFANEAKTEADMMREWANSIYKQYDDKGHYQEQPEGETVDLSLRRYLNAKAMPVKIEESHTVKSMLKEYKGFKNGKKK